MYNRDKAIEFHQVLKKDGTVHSHQWLVLPAASVPEVSVDEVVSRYLAFLRSSSLGLVNPERTGDGIILRLLGLPLIRLCLPVITRDGHTTRADLFINGGLLVQRTACNRGHLRFSLTDSSEQQRIDIRLSDFCPLVLGSHAPSRFRKWLYQFTQALIHKTVTIHFLARLHRELTGNRAQFTIIKHSLSDSEDI